MLRPLFISIIVLVGSVCALGQQKPVSKTVLLDYMGNVLTDREFVDIRMANPSYPDATITRVLGDGTTELRTQKIPQEGTPAPSFVFQTIDGKTITAADLKGKVVVLNFWFIGCAICHAMKPQLNTFMTKFDGRDDIVFIAATADPAGEVEKYAKKESFNYIQAANAGTELKKFVISNYPKNVVISKSGEIVYWRSTIKAWDKFESVVKGELEK